MSAISFIAVTTAVGASQGAPVRFLVVDTSLGLLFVAAGVIAWERRPEVRTGPLLVASAVLWSVGAYAPAGLMPWAVLGFAFERYYDVLLAFLVLTFPDARLQRWDRIVLGALAAGYVIRTSSRLLVGCPCTGSENPFAVVEQQALFERAQLFTSVLIAVAALGVVARALSRLRSSAPAARRILRPVVLAGTVAAIVAAYDAVEIAALVLGRNELLPFGEPWLEIVAWSIIGAVALVPLGFLVGALRLRLRRSAIARLALELDRGTDPQRLRNALRVALDDPGLDLYLWSSAGIWTTASGEPADVPAEDDRRARTLLTGENGAIAAVVHDRALREDPGLVAAATAVLRLAVENERLTALDRARLEEVRASRARLVEAGDRERRRIERDLHDGAQQRLIGVALCLRQARDQAMATDPRARFVDVLDEAAEELRTAVVELRELARGIHPTVLTEEGLRPAVAGLARRAAVPVDLDVRCGRLDPGVEAAAYYIVAEALTNVTRHAHASGATVSISRDDGHLRVEVSDDGGGGADFARGSGLEGLADRLDALSGRLEVASPPGGGTRLRAEIPCE
ncbi:histidine kinase [Blastococcus sp. CT_GayMR16]|uniref:histidine kinase n=1 Tax=Blastococcus sp. CT_GayMR16 TaxID=2559607 RepID=UPI0010738A4C|nr:histidine kinase [Blastococcus sp. CT_GayMR16]TFV88548.1 histidine kinase [Blastococcus sp. CT_GayMR16]